MYEDLDLQFAQQINAVRGLELKEIAQTIEQFEIAMRQRLESEQQGAEQIRRQSIKNLKAIVQLGEEIQKWLSVRRSQDQKSLALLAELGWFIDPNMPFIPPELLEKALSDHSGPEDVVSSLVRFFRERLNAIEQELKDAYPHRSHLFKDAFDAHRTKKYNLSIPVFLSQADGIWQERFSVNLFIGRGRESVAEKYVSDLEHIPAVYLMHPFSISTSPLWIPQGKRKPSFDEFNRHQVLHGASVNYGTEENSLKAISLLSNLCFLLEQTNSTKN